MKSKVLSILLAASVFMLSSCKAAKVLNDESVKAPEMSSEETTEATTAAATKAATEATAEATTEVTTVASAEATDGETTPEETTEDTSDGASAEGGETDTVDSDLTIDDIFDVVYKAAPLDTKGIYANDDNGNTVSGLGCFSLDWGWTIIEFKPDSALFKSLKEGDEYHLTISGRDGSYTASAIYGQYVLTVYEYGSDNKLNCKNPYSKAEAQAVYDAFKTLK